MRLLGFLKKEITQMLRNPTMIAILFVMPVIQITLITFAANNEAKNIRLAMECAPNDSLMQNIRDRALASNWFLKINSVPYSAFESIQKGRSDATLVAPESGFTKSVGNGSPKLQLLIDASNILKAQAIEAYTKLIVISVMEESNLLPFGSLPTINFKSRILFNPEMNSIFFMLPFLIAIIATMLLLSTICVSVTKEKEFGTMETLIAAPIKKSHIILGKTIPYIGVGFINLASLLFVGMTVFGIPFRGSILQFFLSFFIFAISISAFAILLSTFCDTQQQAMLGMIIFLFLSIMLSGGMSPIDNMPAFLNICANITPLSHYISLVRNILLKGSDWEYFLRHTSAILLFGLVSVIFATKRFKITL